MTTLTSSHRVGLLGEAPPRVLVKPHGVRDNSWQDVADLSARLGVRLDSWQELVLEAAMGERTDATWAAKRVGLSVPRQNGKSQLMVSRILAGALLFGEKKIVVSAHQQDTAREAFSKLMEIIEDDANGSLRKRLDPRFGRNGIMNAINREAVRFTTGATVQFKARSGAGGKGFSSDCLLLDEAQILPSRAWTSINSTMSAMPNPQVWLLGTSPQDEDDSFAFDAVRASALAGKSTSSAWCEWGVNVDSDEYRAALPDLLAKRWSPAVEYLCWSGNPAWLTRINHEVVVGECETYFPDKFGQDRLGIWRGEGALPSAINLDEWKAQCVDSAPTDGIRSYGVKFSPDGVSVSLSAAIKRDDGTAHVETIARAPLAEGTWWIVQWFVAEGANGQERHRAAAQIVIDGKAGAVGLGNDLRTAGVPARVLICSGDVDKVEHLTTDNVIAANSMLREAVKRKTVTHLDDPDVLDASVLGTTERKIGTAGGWGFDPKTDDDNATPIESAALAYWAAMTSKRRPGRTTRAKVRSQ